MKIKLIFEDWLDSEHNSIYHTEKGVELSSHNFHSGSVFQGEIHLPEWEEKELRDAIQAGYKPVFYVLDFEKEAP